MKQVEMLDRIGIISVSLQILLSRVGRSQCREFGGSYAVKVWDYIPGAGKYYSG